MDKRSRICISALGLLMVVAASGVAAQDTAAFLATARDAAAAFRERAAAIAAGYRPVGPESPAMGQHWVHPGRLLAERVDPSQPAILSYANVRGRPVLVGVAFALPAGAAVPPGPAPQSAWHVHDGTVLSEAVQPDHSVHGTGAFVPSGVAVLHAWIYVTNPAGTFEPDNWALPFVRAGFDVPLAAAPAAAKALSLATAVDFFADQPGNDRATLEQQAATVRRWLAGRDPGPLTRDELAWLESVWAR